MSQQDQQQNTGLHWVLAAFFLVTDMSIGGQVALPGAIARARNFGPFQFYIILKFLNGHQAAKCNGLLPQKNFKTFQIFLNNTNFQIFLNTLSPPPQISELFPAGLALLALFTVLTSVSSILLGQCWHHLLHQFPAEYGNSHCRKPYAEIGYRAVGPRMRSLVSICVNLTQFGAATVFLLLCAGNTRDFLRVLLQLDDVGMCLPLVVLALLLLPVTMLKSPSDFWPVLFGGMFCTVATFLLICLGSLLDWFGPSAGTIPPQAHMLPEFRLKSCLDAIGPILFAYGGHPAIPTVQHDMRNSAEFTKSSILGFSMISLFNFVVVLLAFRVYGHTLGDSVVGSIQTEWIRQVVMVLISANSLLSIVLIINPLNQEAEELFGVAQRFGRGRVLIRAGVLASLLLVALSVPNFGPVLNLVGASTITLSSLVFPFLFHLCLFGGVGEYLIIRRIFVYFIIGFASLVGLFASWSAVTALFGVRFEIPCYVRPFLFTHP